MEVLVRLVALLVVLLLGTGLRAIGVLGAGRTAWLNAVAYYVALPALIFVSTFDRAIGDLLSPALLAGVVIVLLGTAGIARIVHRNLEPTGRQSVAIIQSYHANLGYLGLPLIAATFEADVTAIASVVLGVGALVQMPLTILVLTSFNEADAAVGDELRSLATNPVLAVLVLALAIGSIGLSIPDPAVAGLDAVGSLALPLALLCVGASLQLDLPTVDAGPTAAVAALKIGWMPVLAWVVFSALAVDSATFAASVVMLGTPTAVSTYVFATELGGDEEFASLNVFVTTVASIVSLFVLIELVG